MRRILALATLLGTLTACGDSAPPPSEPVNACAACRMPIEAAAFSARCLDGGGTPRRFDDVGCLAIEILTERLIAMDVEFHHLEEERWIPRDRAAFVRHPATPMRFGFAAVDEGAGELTFTDVCAELAERFDLRPPASRR